MEPVRKTMKDALKKNPRTRERMHASPSRATSVSDISRSPLATMRTARGAPVPGGTAAARNRGLRRACTRSTGSGYGRPTVLEKVHTGVVFSP